MVTPPSAWAGRGRGLRAGRCRCCADMGAEQASGRFAVARLEGGEDTGVLVDRIAPAAVGAKREIARAFGTGDQRLVRLAQRRVARHPDDGVVDLAVDGEDTRRACRCDDDPPCGSGACAGGRGRARWRAPRRARRPAARCRPAPRTIPRCRRPRCRRCAGCGWGAARSVPRPRAPSWPSRKGVRDTPSSFDSLVSWVCDPGGSSPRMIIVRIRAARALMQAHPLEFGRLSSLRRCPTSAARVPRFLRVHP